MFMFSAYTKSWSKEFFKFPEEGRKILNSLTHGRIPCFVTHGETCNGSNVTSHREKFCSAKSSWNLNITMQKSSASSIYKARQKLCRREEKFSEEAKVFCFLVKTTEQALRNSRQKSDEEVSHGISLISKWHLIWVIIGNYEHSTEPAQILRRINIHGVVRGKLSTREFMGNVSRKSHES